MPLASLADRCGVDADDAGVGRAIDRASLAAALNGRPLAGRAVLVRSGWDAHWRTDRYVEGHPFLTEDAASRLVANGAALVGSDSCNIDDTDDGHHPVHPTLLGAAIPIAEHPTNLGALPVTGLRFSAGPVEVKGMGTFPVRASAVLDE